MILSPAPALLTRAHYACLWVDAATARQDSDNLIRFCRKIRATYVAPLARQSCEFVGKPSPQIADFCSAVPFQTWSLTVLSTVAQVTYSQELKYALRKHFNADMKNKKIPMEPALRKTIEVEVKTRHAGRCHTLVPHAKLAHPGG